MRRLTGAIVLSALTVHAQTPAPVSPAARETRIALKKPVLAAACKVCSWGALGEVIKQAVQPYGYDVQICFVAFWITTTVGRANTTKRGTTNEFIIFTRRAHNSGTRRHQQAS